MKIEMNHGVYWERKHFTEGKVTRLSEIFRIILQISK